MRAVTVHFRNRKGEKGTEGLKITLHSPATQTKGKQEIILRSSKINLNLRKPLCDDQHEALGQLTSGLQCCK